MDEKIFDRIEKKYIITKEQRRRILAESKSHLAQDAYFKSGVYNIYFDTDNFDLIIKSIEKPKFKEKLRARSYAGYDKVFFEIKTKLKGKEANVGYKRRVMITHKDYTDLIKGSKSLVELATQTVEQPTDLQIAQEVDYLICTLKLKPRILVCYDRESYCGENGLRITFDENLRYRDTDLTFDHPDRTTPFFQNDRNIIMEIKAHGALPLWLVHILNSTRTFPTSFSKIGNIYKQILTNRKEKHV